MESKMFLVSVIVVRLQDIGKEIVTHLTTLGNISPLTSLSNISTILNDRALRNYKGSSQPHL